jgi:protein SCO1
MKSLSLSLSLLIAAFSFVVAGEEPLAPPETARPQASLYALDATWTRQNGDKVEWKKSAGTARVVALGYATCKGVCPRIIADMQRIEQSLAADERSRCRFTFVTLDPEHDKVADMKALGERHQVDDTRWDMLTGDGESVLELAVALGVRYDRLPNGIDFAHAYLIAVIGPDGTILHKWVTPDEGPDPSVAALRKAVAK